MTERITEVKNPVSLARTLLDCTSQPLSLRRVPPNLLVGEGATEFAREHDIPVLPHSYLVSPTARHRWQKWKSELDRAEPHRNYSTTERQFRSASQPGNEADTFHADFAPAQISRHAHEQAMQMDIGPSSTPRVVAPLSPPLSDPPDSRFTLPPAHKRSSSAMVMDTMQAESGTSSPDCGYLDPIGPPGMLENVARNPFANSTQKITSPAPLVGTSPPEPALDRKDLSDLQRDGITAKLDERASSSSPRNNIQHSSHSMGPTDGAQDELRFFGDQKVVERMTDSSSSSSTSSSPDDRITDTIGAIAVDRHGRIACAASSGGIGMKHRGRVGPAALVGVGAAVIPADPADPSQTTVASVTSGTGEHMATTMAAATCADRVFWGQRRRQQQRSSSRTQRRESQAASQQESRRPGSGSSVASTGSNSSFASTSSFFSGSDSSSGSHFSSPFESCAPDEAMMSFIRHDFLAHPSVVHSLSPGAIGALCIRKTTQGVEFTYAHNTESFVLASMHAEELQPICTMSRISGKGNTSGNSAGGAPQEARLAQGGRMIRFGGGSRR